MNKQNRGDMPKAPESVDFVNGSPLNGEVLQGGFDQDNIGGGDLRQHNGKVSTGQAAKK